MSDVLTPTISDELYSRPPKLKIFVSSRMRGGVLSAERAAAVQAVEGSSFATAWYWERDAKAGPYSAEAICLGHARTSDGLVLILARDLTPVTYREYMAAQSAGAPCYILLKESVSRTKEVRRFIDQQRSRAVTVHFGNLSELRTQITDALFNYVVQATRKEILRTRLQRQQTPQQIAEPSRVVLRRREGRAR
jgi:hypothetical protein